MPVKIVFFDCDGTLTTEKSSWEFLHRSLRLWSNNADSYQTLFREGKIDYHEFCRRDALLWKGLPVSEVTRIVSTISYREGAAEALLSLKRSGVFTVILSSGISFLVHMVQKTLSIDRAICNELLSEGGYLTGDVRIAVEYNQKGPLVKQLLSERNLTAREAAAVGDGEGDKGMFDEVGLSIGLNGGGVSFFAHPGPLLKTGTLLDAAEIIRRQK